MAEHPFENLQICRERLIALKLVLSMPKSGMDEMLESLHNMQKFYQDRGSAPPTEPSIKIMGPPVPVKVVGQYKLPVPTITEE